MAKFSFSYDDKRVTIVDEKSNKVTDRLDLLEHVELSTAFRALTEGRKADSKASDVSISMLCDVFANTDVLDGYKGKTPHNEKVPTTFLSALREAETELYKPAFIKARVARGTTGSKAEELWQEYRKEELTTGSYSNAKSYVCKMFAHMGQLPIAPNGKMLPLHAIKRMYEAWKAEQEGGNGKKTISEKLVAISSELHDITAAENIGELPDAIAALKRMLATCEMMYSKQLEELTALKGNANIAAAAAQVVKKAQTQTEEAPI